MLKPALPVRVLLVDDQPMFVEALKALLESDDRVDVVAATDNVLTRSSSPRRREPMSRSSTSTCPGSTGSRRHAYSWSARRSCALSW